MASTSCSHADAGDRPDVTQFVDMVTELVARWGTLATNTGDVTLVYDAGQDSVANQAHIDNSPLHFVGSLPEYVNSCWPFCWVGFWGYRACSSVGLIHTRAGWRGGRGGPLGNRSG